MSLRAASGAPKAPYRVVVVDDHPIILGGVRILASKRVADDLARADSRCERAGLLKSV